MKQQSLDSIRKIVNAGVDACLKERGLTRENAGPVAIGRAFVEFYAKQIAYYTNHINDMELIDQGLECDGKDDMGIDFVYEKVDDDEFWICQAKFKGGKSSSLTRDEIAGFFQVHTRILDKHARAKANSSVREALQDITPKSSVTFVLLTSAKASEQNREEFRKLKKKAMKESAGKADNFDWQLVDLSEMKTKHKRAQSGDADLPNVSIPVISVGKQKAYINLFGQILSEGKEYPTVALVIRGTELFNLSQEHEDALFSYNIRGFLGNKGKNRGISDTLEQQPELFYLYNNGIAAICTRLRIVENGAELRLQCDDFQIINGAQTVSSIRKFGDDVPGGAAHLRKVLVLLRVTQTESVKSPTRGLNKSMIMYNNSQNVVRDADFRSNDFVQQALEKEFARGKFQYKAVRPYKEVLYMPKRRVKPKGKLVVDMDDMAKSLFAFKKNNPGKLNSGTKFLFSEKEKDGYWFLFGDEDGQETDVVHQDKVKECVAVAMLNAYLESKHKPGKKQYSQDTVEGMTVRTGRLFLWAFGYVTRELYADSKSKIYRKIIDGSAFAEKSFVPVWYAKIHEMVYTELSRRSSGDNGADGKAFNFKTWLRRGSQVKFFQDRLRYIKNHHHDLPPV